MPRVLIWLQSATCIALHIQMHVVSIAMKSFYKKNIDIMVP
jgi:hypothetical protein